MNSCIIICLGLPKPIAGILKPLLSVISGAADIAIIWEKVKKARMLVYKNEWACPEDICRNVYRDNPNEDGIVR